MIVIRKGSIIDLGFLTIILITIVVGLLFSKLLYNELFSNEQIQEFMNETETGQEMVEEVNNVYNVLNYGIVLIFVGMYITSLILAYRMSTEGAFLIFALILVVFFTFLSAVLSNIYTEIITENTELMNVAEEMSLSFLIMNKLPYLIFFGGMFLIAIMFVGGNDEGYG